MSMLPTRSLGRIGLDVTALGFGGAPLGCFRGFIPRQQASATLDAAWEAGVRYYDTAPFYGYGRSENRTGLMLQEQPRDEFVISTKVGRVLTPLKDQIPPPYARSGGLPFLETFDYSYDGIMRSLEHSHLRLGLDRIDLLYTHDVDTNGGRTEEHAEAMLRQVTSSGVKALEQLRASGAIRGFGLGLNQVAWCMRFLKEVDLDVVLLAGEYTLLDQRAAVEMLPLCQQRGIGVVLGGPYNSGVLAVGAKEGADFNYAAAPPEILQRVRALEAVCGRHNVALPAAALHFVLAHPAISAIIPGAVHPDEVRANVQHVAAEIPAAFWQDLRTSGLVIPEAPLPV